MENVIFGTKHSKFKVLFLLFIMWQVALGQTAVAHPSSFLTIQNESCTPFSEQIEAETGTLSGNFEVGSDVDASGGEFVHAPDVGLFKGEPSEHFVEFCFNTLASGEYQIKTRVYAANGQDNSFHVNIDDTPINGYLWDTPDNVTNFTIDYVSERNGADPVTWTLDAGEHTLRFYVREDGAQLDWIEIEKIGDDAPIITNPGDQSDTENDTISLQIDAIDPENGTLTYSADGLPDGLNINSSTGEISGTLTYSSAGSYDVEVTVSDGSYEPMVEFEWTVTNLNRLPSVTNPGDQTHTEGETVSLQISASDADGEALTFSADELPNSLTIDSNSGLISGQLDIGSAAEYDVTVTVDDGNDEVEISFTWTVVEQSEASITIVATTNGEEADTPTGPGIVVGENVDFNYTVTNDGEFDLVDVVITDSELGQVCTVDSLDIGENASCSESETAVLGQYSATVTATGDPVDENGAPATNPDGSTVASPSDSDPIHYIGYELVNPNINIEMKTNGEDADNIPGVGIPTGDPVEWGYTVTNNGDIALDITITDSELGQICTIPSLAVSASTSCSVSGTAVEGQYSATATATGIPVDEDGNPATYPDGSAMPTAAESDSSHYLGFVAEQASITLEFTTNGFDADEPTGPTLPFGEPINWVYVVTNNGAFDLKRVEILDDQLGDICIINDLAIEEAATCTASGLAEEGQYAATASVVGEPVDENGDNALYPDGSEVPDTSDTDLSHYFGYVPLLPEIDLELTTNGFDADEPTGPILLEGTAVEWLYTLHNSGNLDLEDVTVTDDQQGAVCTITLLTAGETETCTVNGTAVLGQYSATATATGTPVDANQNPIPDVDDPSDSDPTHYSGTDNVTPAITLEKTVYPGHNSGTGCANGQELALGEVGTPITFCFEITNFGTTYVDSLELDDPALAIDATDLTAFGEAEYPLAPGESVIYFYETAVTTDFVNVATAVMRPVNESGTPYSGVTSPTDSDSAEVDAITQAICSGGSLRRLQLYGRGVGDRYEATNPATLSLPAHMEATALSTRLVGQLRPDLNTAVHPSLVTYQSIMQTINLAAPNQVDTYAYAFNKALTPVTTLTASWQDPTGGYQTARGLVAQATYPTNSRFLNSSNNSLAFVYHRMGENEIAKTLTFAPTTAVTTIYVQAAVVGNHADSSKLIVNAQAGNKIESVTVRDATHGEQLNLVSIALKNVPIGTSNVTVTLISPTANGDSGILSNVIASVRCTPDADADHINDLDDGGMDSDGDEIPNYKDIDDDNDGVLTMNEDPNGNHNPLDDDTDGDGIPNYLDPDDDGDDVATAVELYHLSSFGTVADFDHDGIPNYLDTDDDNDGLPTATEAGLVNGFGPDTDGDGIVDSIEGNGNKDRDEFPNAEDLDSDGDNIPDSLEGSGDVDGDDIPNFLDQDSDGDTISDVIEGIVDSDGDGTPNYLDWDSDDDNVPDSEERTKDRDHDDIDNYLDTDADGDGIPDYDEYVNDDDHLLLGCSAWGNPDCHNNDLDGDGIDNYLDTDSDGDGIPDESDSFGGNVIFLPFINR